MKTTKKIILISSFIIAIAVFSSLGFAATSGVDCASCEVNYCSCTITGCPKNSGVLNVYDMFDCSGIPIAKASFTGGTKVWHPSKPGNFYANAFCDDRTTLVPCTLINVAGEITTSTTTSEQKRTTTTTKKGGGGGGDYTWVLALIILIVIVVVVYFLFLKKPAKKTSSYESLYRKWGRR